MISHALIAILQSRYCHGLWNESYLFADVEYNHELYASDYIDVNLTQIDQVLAYKINCVVAVSYTHLTLPTIYSV